MDNFWEIIERARRLAVDGNMRPINAISSVLSGLASKDIAAFDKSFFDAACLLDTTEFFAAALILRHELVTDDGFEYFKNWLILQGKDRFERTVENPDSLADLITAEVDPLLWEVESIGAATGIAYEQKTGRTIDADFPDDRGWYEPDFDDSQAAISAARKRLPRLVRAMKKR